MFELMTDEITIESLESDIKFDTMYKDVLISFITEADNDTTNTTTPNTNNAPTTDSDIPTNTTTSSNTDNDHPSTTEKEMSKNGPSKFRQFVDSVIDFISDIVNRVQICLTEFFTDKEIMFNIKKINDIVNKTGIKTRYEADTWGTASPYVNKLFATVNIGKLEFLIGTYISKMKNDKEHAAEVFKKYEEERKKLIESGDAMIDYPISIFLKEMNVNNYKNKWLPELKRRINEITNSVNSEVKNMDESDTEKKRIYTNYLNYMRRLMNYWLRDIKLVISSFRYNIERAYKIGELGMKSRKTDK